MSVTETEFNNDIDVLFERIEEALEAADADADIENSSGVLTLEFENDTTMVFSRQVATCQLWLAARSGGYHFQYDADQGDWCCTRTGRFFRAALREELEQQAGIAIEFD